MNLLDRTISGVACWYGMPTTGMRGAPPGARFRHGCFRASLADHLPELWLHHGHPIGQVVGYQDGPRCLEVIAVIDRPERNPAAAQVLGLIHSGQAYPPALSVGCGPSLWRGLDIAESMLLEVSIVERGACAGAGVYGLGLPLWAVPA